MKMTDRAHPEPCWSNCYRRWMPHIEDGAGSPSRWYSCARGCVRHLRPAGPPAYVSEHSMAVCNPQ